MPNTAKPPAAAWQSRFSATNTLNQPFHPKGLIIPLFSPDYFFPTTLAVLPFAFSPTALLGIVGICKQHSIL